MRIYIEFYFILKYSVTTAFCKILIYFISNKYTPFDYAIVFIKKVKTNLSVQ